MQLVKKVGRWSQTFLLLNYVFYDGDNLCFAGKICLRPFYESVGMLFCYRHFIILLVIMYSDKLCETNVNKTGRQFSSLFLAPSQVASDVFCQSVMWKDAPTWGMFFWLVHLTSTTAHTCLNNLLFIHLLTMILTCLTWMKMMANSCIHPSVQEFIFFFTLNSGSDFLVNWFVEDFIPIVGQEKDSAIR